MKKEWKKAIIACGVLCVIIVIGLFAYKWLSIPAGVNIRIQVESEEELIKALKKGVPDMVYPFSFIEEFEQENLRFEIAKSRRYFFAPANGYNITGVITIGDKRCRVDMGGVAKEYIKDQCSFEYRTAEGHYNKLKRDGSGGYISFGLEGQHYWISYGPEYSPTHGRIVTDEIAEIINDHMIQQAKQIIDMKLDGDTIGK